MPYETQPDLQDGATPTQNLGGGARIYVMSNARKPTPGTLRHDIALAGCAPPAVADGCRTEATVLQFPVRKRGRFDPATRAYLTRLAARMPGLQPLSFGFDERGVEWCRFGNGLVMSLEKSDRMILTDTFSGYVDHGPFDSLDEICLLIVGLDS